MENNVFCCLPLRDVKYEKERERIILKQLLYKYNYYSEFSIHVYPFIKWMRNIIDKTTILLKEYCDISCFTDFIYALF